MSADEILKVIQEIPNYITYIYPGYLTIYAYLFFKGKTLKDSNYIFIKSIAISYVYLGIIEGLKSITLLNCIKANIKVNIPDTIKFNLYLIVLSVLFDMFLIDLRYRKLSVFSSE